MAVGTPGRPVGAPHAPGLGVYDAAREAGGPSAVMRGFITSVRLGWQMEANWTDPLLFIIYSVAKPVSSALILVFMLEVIAGEAGRSFRSFVVIGSALWAFVMSGIAGLAWAILDDRERYRMLKYLYVSPTNFLVVVLGRGVARLAVGAMGAVITLAVGVVALGVPFDIAAIDWPLLIISIAIGVVAITALAIVMAAVCIQTRMESWSYPEAAAGGLFLVSGAVFPVAVLPAPVQAIALVNPLTWWIVGMRDALFPGGISSVGGIDSVFWDWFGHASPAPNETIVALLATGALATLGATVIFRVSEHRAKDRGLLDRTTGS